MKIICAGDSLTRGQVSADYVAMLQNRFAATTVNAGVNYELSSGLRQRLDAIVAQQPDVVTVLTGTNNVRYTLSAIDAAALRRRWKTTDEISAKTYRQDLVGIAEHLLTRTRARVAFLSLPVIGEDLHSPPVQRAAEYSEIVRTVAAERHIAYLPLHERMTAFLRDAGHTPGTAWRPGALLASTAAIQHFVLRRSFDAVSASRGLLLTTDTVHLNGRAAAMIADLIAEFVTDDKTTAEADSASAGRSPTTH
jgi:lysophospholipase L1-like esterase